MTCTFEMDKSAGEFEKDILRMLGIRGRRIVKMVLVFEQNQLPIIQIDEILLSVPDALVTKTYAITEVD